MKNEVFEKAKTYFKFLSLTDKEIMNIVERTFDDNKSIDENFEKIIKVFYSVVKENYKNGDLSLIILSNQFSYDSFINAVNSLNNFAIFLDKCGITFSIELEDKIKEESYDLDNTLKKISEAGKDYIDKLNSLALRLFQESSYYVSEELILSIDEEDMSEEISFDDVSFTDDSTKQYLKEIGKIPLLTPDEEKTIFKRYRETKDLKIRDRIIEANLRLVIPIASRYQRRASGITLLELVSVGTEGLIRALDDYDPDKSKFSTYATYWIKQKILRWIQNNSSNIRIPINLRQNIIKFHKQKVQLETEYGRTLSIEELSEKTGISVKKILDYEKIYLQFSSVSINSPVGEDEDSELVDFIEDTDTLTPEEKAIFNDSTNVDEWLSHLNETERIIIMLRNGLYDGRVYSLEEVSDKLCKLGLRDNVVSRQRIEQIESKALRKLRNLIQSQRSRKTVTRIRINETSKKVDDNKINLEFLKLIKLVRITDVMILSKSVYELPDSAKETLRKCFGNNIFAGVPLSPTMEVKEDAAFRVLPLLHKIIKKNIELQKQVSTEEIEMPRNIYDYFVNCTQYDVDKAISELLPSDRLALAKCYDMYSGDYKSDNVATFKDKKNILNILKAIEFNLPRVKNKTKKKGN